MTDTEIHKYMHDLRNSLNTATINACLLRRLHPNTLDNEVIERLDAALLEAEKVVSTFQNHVRKDASISE